MLGSCGLQRSPVLSVPASCCQLLLVVLLFPCDGCCPWELHAMHVGLVFMAAGACTLSPVVAACCVAAAVAARRCRGRQPSMQALCELLPHQGHAWQLLHGEGASAW